HQLNQEARVEDLFDDRQRLAGNADFYCVFHCCTWSSIDAGIGFGRNVTESTESTWTRQLNSWSSSLTTVCASSMLARLNATSRAVAAISSPSRAGFS